MLLGLVEGVVVSHHKHRSMYGWKLLLVQPLNIRGGPDADPVLAVDPLGAGRGQKVLISSDGRGTRELLQDNTTPVRWSVVGIVDEPS